MKTVVIMRIPAHHLPHGAEGLFRDTGCKPNVTSIDDSTILDVHAVIVWLKFDAGDPVVALVHSYLDKHGVKVFGGEVDEYSNEDLQSARLLWMTPDINESVSAGHIDGTKYDMTDACPNCAAGARQTSALYIDGDDGPAKIRKHRAIGTWDGDILVDGGMAKKLKDAGVTGISFGEVRARLKNKKWSMVAREQILIAHTMPPRGFEPTSTEDKYLCKVCRRGVGSTPLKSYRSVDLVGMQDFNLTWEWFGDFWPKPKEKNRHAKWPHPHVLVTPKVMNIFRDAGVKTFEWTPVFIDE